MKASISGLVGTACSSRAALRITRAEYAASVAEASLRPMCSASERPIGSRYGPVSIRWRTFSVTRLRSRGALS